MRGNGLLCVMTWDMVMGKGKRRLGHGLGRIKKLFAFVFFLFQSAPVSPSSFS